MSKNYVYVEQEDGSTVERGSLNRVYTHAVAFRGIRIGASRIDLKRRIEAMKLEIIADGDRIQDYLNETPEVIDEHTWGKNDELGYVTYLFGETNLHVSKSQDLETVKAASISLVSEKITRTAEQVKQCEDAVRELGSSPVDDLITTEMALKYPVLVQYAPAVVGFSQSRENAMKRAVTEERVRIYNARTAVVLPTVKGKRPKSTLKGFKA